MKKNFLITALVFLALTGACQKTLVVEKIGTRTKYGFSPGDYIKLKVRSTHQVLKKSITDLNDTVITMGIYHKVSLNDVGTVYKDFNFPKRLGYNLLLAGGIFCVAFTTNSILNHEPVYNTSNVIIAGSILAAGTISLVLSQKAMKIGLRWKLKVLEIPRL